MKSIFRVILAISAILALGAGPGLIQREIPADQARSDIRVPTAPAKEVATDCDDCVIVKIESAALVPEDPSPASGTPATGLMASTLWGLFMVARPRRLHRTIIRGVKVP